MTSKLWLFTSAVAAVIAAAACGDGGGEADAGADAPGDGSGLPPELVGSIRILEERRVVDESGTPAETRYGTAGGAYVVGRQPRWHQEVMRSSDCVLRRYLPSPCMPACTAGLCVATDVCEPFPTFQSAGPLTATGLAVALTMVGADGTYDVEDPLPADLFADDAVIEISLAGAAFPAHTMSGRGVPPLAAAITDGRILLVPGQDHVLRWTPAASDARVQVTLNADNSAAGLPYLGVIECDAADHVGQITIPARLVDAFPTTMAWTTCTLTDCPPSTVRRYRRSAIVVGDAEVELVIGSQLVFGVEHSAP